MPFSVLEPTTCPEKGFYFSHKPKPKTLKEESKKEVEEEPLLSLFLIINIHSLVLWQVHLSFSLSLYHAQGTDVGDKPKWHRYTTTNPTVMSMDKDTNEKEKPSNLDQT
ncbi:hypothetical protein V6Z12_D07G037800 [Gossypium hirsutum]